MKQILLSIFLMLGLVAGCSNKNESNQQKQDNENTELLEVSIQTVPDTIKANEEVKIEALVTQGEEKVEDAKEVKFEIWKTGQENHEMTVGTKENEGVYSISKTFTEDGQYFVTAHVTARNMHAMPKKEITVGKTATSHEGGVEHSEEHHQGSELVIELNKDQSFQSNKENSLSAVIQQEGKPLTDAEITFEVWEGDSEKREWIDAKEGESGVYSASKTFETSGTYHVQVHLKKGELHDHKHEMIDVK